MKKTNNKGFSLVELIIVIAIMAILVGAIAPALIRYIDKSRKSNDMSSAKTIKTAVETALGNEDIYAYLTNTSAGTVIAFDSGKASTEGGAGNDAIHITGCEVPDDCPDDIAKTAADEIGTNIGEKIPKVKFKKANDSDEKGQKLSKCTAKPEAFYIMISPKGTVYVMIGAKSASLELPTEGADAVDYEAAYLVLPETCPYYQ